MIKYILIWMLCVFSVSITYAASEQECYEGSEFIKNAALLRDSGRVEGVKENFITQMFEDFEKLKTIPEDFRWFVVNEDDEIFLLNQALKVWEEPTLPEQHEKYFLTECLQYIKN